MSHRPTEDPVIARVKHVDRGLVTVLVDGAPLRASLGGDLLDRIAREPAAAPCAGDWCELRRWPDGPVTVERVRRRGPSLLLADVGGPGGGRLLAANLDLVVVVVALVPAPARSWVDRLLTAAKAGGARPLVVLTEADALHQGSPSDVSPPPQAAELKRHIGTVAPGVQVLTLGGTEAPGAEELRRVLGGGTAALIGDGGAGRARLVDTLVGAPVLRAARVAGSAGRRRSARCELVELPGGGALIDTPDLCGGGLHERRGRGNA